jgi:16S rRNA (guanine527-N7)-methyltransferase
MTEQTKNISRALRRLPAVFPASAADSMSTLLSELARWNKRVNLTAIRNRDEMITAHLLDSLIAAPLCQGETILDVGTGAGFPGLPLAIVLPDCHFTLLDSNNKKIQFVRHMAGLVDLKNVTAVKARAEDYAPGHGFDTVIARALATLTRLLDMAGHHVREDGVFVALKGRYPTQELEEIEHPWQYAVQALSVPGLDKGSRHAVLLRRDAA